MADFDAAFKATIGHEGGYVNDPVDPGGETKYGISKRAYPDLDIKNLTLEQAKDIYRRDYWLPLDVGGETDRLAAKAFDIAVNMGVNVAKVMLEVAQDFGLADRETTMILGLLQARRYLNIIARNPKMAKYAKGWARRADA